MSEVWGTLLLLFALGLLSFSWGVLRAIRDVLAERTADWLLPERQPVTFRLGQFLTFLAAVIAPRHAREWDFDSEGKPWWHLFHPFRWHAFHWPEPDALLAEMEFDLEDEQQVLDPVRLAFPLLLKALELRLIYIRKIATCLTWIPFGLLLTLVWTSAFVGFELGFFLSDLTVNRVRTRGQDLGRWTRSLFRR